VVYEVSKRLSQAYDQDTYDRAMRYLKLGQFVGADWDLMAQAALTSRRYKLHMADAIIWQTAQANSATLYTQDAAFDGLTGVVYQPKSS
jgi:predicted nucleic acid-binding protein